jgi:hypothetical protein
MAKKQDKADDAPDFLGDGFDEYSGTNPNLPEFGVGGNIFTIPVGGLLAQGSIIGADAGTPGSLTIGNLGSTPSGASSNLFTGISTTSGPSFGDLLNTPTNLGSTILSGVGPTFTAPATNISFGAPGAMTPTNISLGDLINPYAQRTDITQLAPNWGTWNPSTDVTTAADFSGVKLTGTPFSNVGIDQTAISGGRPTVTAGSEISTTAAQGGAVQLDPFEVSGTRVETGPMVNLSDIYTPRVTGGEGLLGGVSTTAPGTALVMDPFQVTATNLPRATLNLTPPSQTSTTTGGAGAGTSSDVTQLPAVTVTGTRDTTPTMSTPDMIDLLNRTNVNVGQPVQLPRFVTTTSSTTATTTVTPVTPNVTTPTINPPPSGVIIPPQVTVPPVTTTPPPTTITPTTTPTATTVGPATPTAPTTTTTSSAMNQRDLKAELEKTMAAFNEYRPQIQSMYGDLYQQFMPKGLTAAEPGIINQYQADLARLQQRQAGMLSPEDVRQSQQSAREAYGARGQVMGPGAIGAEILNREAIRQQREEQARAALQQSYGNILNTANIQTGNLFSPIASLMSGTFNPLGAYPADVYGTNVNAQLARDIAQKNYEAAIRSAELSGAAQKSAATTSATGNILGPALGTVAAKGIGTLFGLPIPSCMPGDQCIDTPTGPKAIKDLKGGDEVIGYDGNVAYIAQACSWNQDPLRTFLTIIREDGSSFTVCDDHKVIGIPAMEWVEGAELAGSKIKEIKASTGILTSYDILTNQGGYRINGVPVNSMIPEIIMQVVEFHRQVDRNLQTASA